MTFSNFKNFGDVEFEFSGKNVLSGRNGAGKSSILDGIMFLLYGRTADGSLAESTKLIKNGEEKCSVSAMFNDGTSLKRVRSEKATRVYYGDGSQEELDSQVTQRDLESIIPPYEIFASIFHVGFFMSQDDKKKREMILSLTEIDDENARVLELIGQSIKYFDKYGISLQDFPKAHKRCLDLRREAESDIVGEKAMIEILSTEIKIPDYPETNDIDSRISAMRASGEEWLKYERLFAEYQIKKGNHDDYLLRKSKLKEALDSLVLPGLPAEYDYDKLQSLNGKLAVLKNEYEKQRILIENFVSNPICGTCGQTVSSDILASYRASLEEIKKEGIRLKEEVQVENELKLKYEQDLDSYNQAVRERSRLQNDLKELSFVVEPLEPRKPDVVFHRPSYDALIEEKRAIDSAIILHEEAASRELARKEQLDRHKQSLSMLEETVYEINIVLALVAPKGIPSELMRMRLDMVHSVLGKYVDGAEIITLEPLKNGMDIKEIFTVQVDGKEYSKLSYGEKMKLDIAISRTIDDLTGNSVGMLFLDNSESIDHVPDIPNQSFIARVSDGDFTITNQ